MTNAPADQVVITGVGLATCLGLDAFATWSAVREGRCGWGPLRAIEGTARGECHGGQAIDLPGTGPGARREVDYLRLVVRAALAGAGVGPEMPYPGERCASVLGTTLHGMRRAGDHL